MMINVSSTYVDESNLCIYDYESNRFSKNVSGEFSNGIQVWIENQISAIFWVFAIDDSFILITEG